MGTVYLHFVLIALLCVASLPADGRLSTSKADSLPLRTRRLLIDSVAQPAPAPMPSMESEFNPPSSSNPLPQQPAAAPAVNVPSMSPHSGVPGAAPSPALLLPDTTWLSPAEAPAAMEDSPPMYISTQTLQQEFSSCALVASPFLVASPQDACNLIMEGLTSCDSFIKLYEACQGAYDMQNCQQLESTYNNCVSPAEPVPEPQPVPEPVPEPQPVPEPVPEPQPVPEPVPEPQPVPEPVPEPQPVPEPVPEPQPVPEPVPEPQPTPAAPASGGCTFIVAPGDTMSAIATMYGISLEQLVGMNPQVADPNMIQVGWTINIPCTQQNSNPTPAAIIPPKSDPAPAAPSTPNPDPVQPTGDGIIWGNYAGSGGQIGGEGPAYATYHYYGPYYYTSSLYCADQFAPLLAAGRGKELLQYPWTAFCNNVPGGLGPMTPDKCGKHLKATNPATGQWVILTVVDMCGQGGVDIDPVGFNAIDGNGAGVRDGHMHLNLEWV